MPVIIFRNMVTTTFPGVGNPSVEVALDGVTVQTVSASCVTNSVTYDVYRRPITQTDGRGNVTTRAYDALGRLASVTDAAGAVTAYAYDAAGRVAAVTNALGNVTVYDYDLRGNRTYEGGATYPVVYEYDAFGQKVSMTTFRDETSDDAGDTTTWAYDEATGALVSKTYADGRGVAYTLTDLGQVATRTDARGIVTTYAYNVYGDLVSQTYSDATPTVTYAYDALGRQAQATDAVGTTTFGYNAYGELETEAISGLYAKTLTHHFDAYGRNVGYSVNGSRRTFLGYDGDTGRIAAMNEGGDFHWEYLPGSDLKARLTYPNGLTAEWAYEPERDLLTAVTNSLPNGTTLSAYVYTNDLLGRRTSKNDEQYGYNVRDELTSANERTYAYDDIGNRTTAEGRSYTANNLNQYTAIDGFAPTFDADGNQTKVLTETGEWTVEYNAENRPIRWTQGNKVITMGFDRMGRRVFYKEMEGNRQITHTVFLYDGYLCIQQLFSNSPWNVYKEFIWDPTEPLATRPLCFRQYGQRSAFLLHDGNKNVTDVVTVGPFNEPVAHYDYAPFGAVTATGARALTNPFRFSSEFHDDTLALAYYNYRHYNPKDGRWLGRDAVETENVYSFCGNDSITIVDVYGRVGINTKLLSYYMSRLGNGRVINGIIDILSSDSEGYYSFTDSEDELKSDFVAIAKNAVIHDAVDITIDEFNVWTTRSFSTTKSWQISEKFRVTLNSSSRVELSGTYKVKQCEDGRRFVKDATCDVVWYDEMDANSFRELYYKEVIGGGGWEKVSSSRAIILITEGLVDLVGDKTLGADFKFKISKSVRYGGCCEE